MGVSPQGLQSPAGGPDDRPLPFLSHPFSCTRSPTRLHLPMPGAFTQQNTCSRADRDSTQQDACPRNKGLFTQSKGPFTQRNARFPTDLSQGSKHGRISTLTMFRQWAMRTLGRKWWVPCRDLTATTSESACRGTERGTRDRTKRIHICIHVPMRTQANTIACKHAQMLRRHKLQVAVGSSTPVFESEEASAATSGSKRGGCSVTWLATTSVSS